MCDPCGDRCVPQGQPIDCTDSDDPDAAVRVSALTVQWSTPNQARWSWSVAPESVPDQLAGYELTIAENETDLRNTTGTARTFTASDNPELGRFSLPRADGEEVVTATIVDGLTAGTAYVARLVAVDSIGRRSLSNIATARTQDPAVLGSAVIYSDVLAAGYSIPSEFSHSDSDPFAGDACYRWQQQDGCPACWENLRLAGIDVDLSAVTAGAFATSAYLEFSVSLRAPTPGYWAEVRLLINDDPNEQLKATFAPITYRATSEGSAYRTYQVPLRAFDDSTTTLTAEHLKMYPIHEVGIGALWDNDAVVQLDEVRVYW